MIECDLRVRKTFKSLSMHIGPFKLFEMINLHVGIFHRLVIYYYFYIMFNIISNRPLK